MVVTASAALSLTAVTLAAFAGVGIWYSRGGEGSIEDFLTARDSAGTGTAP